MHLTGGKWWWNPSDTIGLHLNHQLTAIDHHCTHMTVHWTELGKPFSALLVQSIALTRTEWVAWFQCSTWGQRSVTAMNMLLILEYVPVLISEPKKSTNQYQCFPRTRLQHWPTESNISLIQSVDASVVKSYIHNPCWRRLVRAIMATQKLSQLWWQWYGSAYVMFVALS